MFRIRNSAKKCSDLIHDPAGDDATMKTLVEKATEAGVNVKYQLSDKPTGRYRAC